MPIINMYGKHSIKPNSNLLQENGKEDSAPSETKSPEATDEDRTKETAES